MVTIGAMAFALFVECLYSGLIPGYMNAMLEDITQLEVGDIQVHAGGYRNSPSLYTTIDDPAAVISAVEGMGYLGSARLLGGGLGASGEFSAGVALRGVNVAQDAAVCGVSGKIAEGTWLDASDQKGVVLGKFLARTLNAKPGSELLLLSQATDGSMANELYTVRGVLGSVAEATDRVTVYMTEAAFRDLFVMPTGAHQIVVKVPPKTDLVEASTALDDHLKAHYLESPYATEKNCWACDAKPGEGCTITVGDATKFKALGQPGEVGEPHPDEHEARILEVKTWKQIMPIIGQMLDSVQGMIFILYFIIYIAVGILILNAMLMAVFERIKEFGVFKAIGAGPLHVLALILLEAAMQTTLAIVIGLSAAAPGMWWIANKGIDFGSMGGMNMMGVSMRKMWYGIYDAQTLSGPLIMLVVVVAMAVIYPAMKAAWINPVTAMRHR